MLRYLLILLFSTLFSTICLLLLHTQIWAYLESTPRPIVLSDQGYNPTPFPTTSTPMQAPVYPIHISPDDIKQVVQQSLEGTSSHYGVMVRHIPSGTTYGYHEHDPFEPASLYKLWVMATVEEEISAGNLQYEQQLSETIETLNKRFFIEPENAELTEGVISHSVSEALEKMITVSDNYSALLLTEKIRLSRVAKFLKNHGFSESKVGDTSVNPTTTAADMALFFTLLSEGKLADESSTQYMLDLLKKQTIKRKIPKYLPQTTVIAHKTGEMNQFSHDAGIISSPQGDYILVLMSESPTPADAEDKLSKISESVYQLFSRTN